MFSCGEDNMVCSVKRELHTGPRSHRPSACVETSCAGAGRARRRLTSPIASPAGEGLWPQSQHVRNRAVGQVNTTREVVEQKPRRWREPL